METSRPVWLDACYVQKVLRKANEDESIEVSSVKVEQATAEGDNYHSDMYRIGVVLSRVHRGDKITETKSLIAKVAPYEGGPREDFVSGSGYFETELSMMFETLPLMNQIHAKSGPSEFSARCLHVQFGKPLHLIIEDLVPKGFRMAERRVGLDLDHCLLAIRNLAAFHATSVALKEKDPRALLKYNRGLLNKSRSEAFVSFLTAGARTMAKEITKWSEVCPSIPEKMLILAESIFEKGCEAAHFREDDFNVLNHGDFWTNNMLFRYDKQQKPIDVTFVDFQISFYGSPSFDILYFIGTTPSDDVRMNHRDLLVQEYHTSLTSTMAKLECQTKAPSFKNLQEILKERAFCEVVSTISLLPIMLAEKSQVKGWDEMNVPDGKYEHPAYQGKLFRKMMTRLLPLYDSMGLLDV